MRGFPIIGKIEQNDKHPCIRNNEFGLGVLFNWARKPSQTKALRKTMQEGHCATVKAVAGENEGQRARVTTGKGKTAQDSSCSL